MNFFKEHGDFIEPKQKKIDDKQLGYYVPFKEKLEVYKLQAWSRRYLLAAHKNSFSKICKKDS